MNRLRPFLRMALAVALVAAATGCGDDDEPMMSDDDAGTSDAGPGDAGPGDAALPDPMIQSLIAAESPNSVLVYRVSFTTDLETQGVVEVLPTGGDPWMVPGTTELGTEHEVLVLGLQAETEYAFRVTATTSDGRSATADTDAVTTAALPTDLPPLDVEVLDATAVAEGYTLFGTRRWTPSQDAEWGYLIALDESGTVVWYLDVGRPTGDLRMRENGNLVYQAGNISMTEITMDGETVWTHEAPDVGIDSFHHEAFPTADGNLVVLSSELRSVDGYPGGETHDVVGDTVAVLSGDGSSLVAEHSLLDVLDPLRTRPGFDNPYWNSHYADEVSSTKDWSHGNAVIEDPSDGNFILSLRHQDWLVKIDASTGDVIWHLGEDGDFTMSGTGEWTYHQHAPEVQDDGSLLVYDNGNARTTLASDEVPYTRIVQYDIDETAMTVTQVWEYRGESAYFSPFVGDADRLPNGNVLIADGGLIVGCPDATDDAACAVGAPTTQKWARIVQITGTDTPEAVMRIEVRDDATTDPTGYTIYRAEHLESLYGAGE